MRTSSVSQHTVPPVYACYLLRSQAKPNVTYVGSTPDPARRLRQHNGQIAAGAFHTRFARPWQMDLVVCGFPSRLAALQFEWSWQKPNISRHLRRVDVASPLAVHAGRSSEPLFPGDRPSVSTDRAGKRRTKLRVSVVPENRFLVMRALLASEPFCFWNLQVIFFTEWAYGVWLHLERTAPAPLFATGRVTGRVLPATYPRIVCDFTGVSGTATPLASDTPWPELPEAQTESAWQKQQRNPRRRKKRDEDDNTGWPERMPLARSAPALGLTWDDLHRAPQAPTLPPSRAKASPAPRHDDHACTALERTLLERSTDTPLPAAKQAFVQKARTCGVCHEPVDLHDATAYSLCPSRTQTCTDVFHLECLAQHSQDAHPAPRTFCLPLESACPSCQGTPAPWPEVVRRVFRRAELLS